MTKRWRPRDVHAVLSNSCRGNSSLSAPGVSAKMPKRWSKPKEGSSSVRAVESPSQRSRLRSRWPRHAACTIEAYFFSLRRTTMGRDMLACDTWSIRGPLRGGQLQDDGSPTGGRWRAPDHGVPAEPLMIAK